MKVQRLETDAEKKQVCPICGSPFCYAKCYGHGLEQNKDDEKEKKMDRHKELLEAANYAIDRLFSDTSVSAEQTARSLGTVKDDIEEKLEGLPEPGIE